MELFDQIRKRVSETGSAFRLGTADIEALKKRHPNLPEDYLKFLAQVGYGNLGELQLYSAPTSPESIYSSLPRELNHVLVFGDDMQGCCLGFDMSNGYQVVEISPSGDVAADIEPDFTSLLRS